MKKMKNFIALLLALVMTMSLMACGNKTDEETKTGEDIGCYVQTTESGEKVLVDKDGNAVTDYTLDDEGNVVDTQGVVVVKAADITAYEESEEKDAENKTDASEADTQKPEDAAKPDGENKSDAQKTDAKVDNTKKDETKKDDAKQETQKPATPSYDNGSLTTAQVKELQRWYGVSADGQWGAGSKKAAGGRTADEAWAYYQSNKQITTPEAPSGGNAGNTGNTGNTGSTGSTGGGSTTPTAPSVPTPATNIDWNAVIAAGNEYGKSVGFDLSHPEECRSHFPPAIFENESLLYKYPPTQDSAINVMKSMIDDTKAALVKANGFTHMDEGVIGADGQPFASGIKCAVEVDSDGLHVLYVWYF